MELLCPNCQQRVTVPDQFAGQVMKCPLCANTFTTPSLPGAGAAVYMPPPPPVPPMPEPFAAPQPSAAPSGSAPVMHSPAPEPIPGDYRHRINIWISPRVLPWIAVAAMVIVFILLFFSWAGYYPGGMPVATQTGWQAAFGSSTHDPAFEKEPPLSNEKGEELVQARANWLLVFFALLFILALIVTVAAAALGVLPGRLPPAVERLSPWRWVIASALILLAFLLFGLQLLSGLSLTNDLENRLERKGTNESNNASDPKAKKLAEAETALHESAIRYTCALWCSFWLTLLALLCAALTFILNRRTSRPLPRIELLL